MILCAIFLIKEYVFNGTRKDLQPEQSDPEAGEEVGAGKSKPTKGTSRESGGFRGWLANTFECIFSEEKMIQLAGRDAALYLRFQCCIIFFVMLLTLLSIGVILPINFQGNNYGNKSDFGHSTVINLEAG